MASDEITAFLSEWAAAERAGDATALESLLTDDFMGVGPVGFMLSRKLWLDRYATKALAYEEFSLEETRIRRYGDTAVVIGRQNQRGNVKGQPVPTAARVTLVLVKQSDR